MRDEIDLLWGKGTAGRLTTVHPLQAFSRTYFEEDSGLQTYAKEWRAAQSASPAGVVSDREALAKKPSRSETALTGSSVDLLPPLESAQGVPVITLTQLTRFLRKPVGAFFRERLQVHLEDERSELHDEELFGLAGLDLYQLIDHELQHVPTELSADSLPAHVQQVVQSLRQAGALPLAGVGKLARRDWADAANGNGWVDGIENVVEGSCVATNIAGKILNYKNNSQTQDMQGI